MFLNGFKAFFLLPTLIFRQYFARQFYYLLLEFGIVFISAVLYFGFIGFKFSYIFNVILIAYLLIMTAYIFDSLIFQQRIRSQKNIFGFTRWDKVHELHIGGINNKLKFQRKLLNTLLYCRDKKIKIEFISGYRSYGRLIRDFGDAVVLIQPIGSLSQIFVGSLIHSFEKEKSVNSDHLLKVLIDPTLIKYKQLKNGKNVLWLK